MSIGGLRRGPLQALLVVAALVVTALLLTGAVVLVVSAVVALLALRQIRAGFAVFQRSREELVRNLSWLRTVLVYSGRSYKGRRA